MKRVFPIIILTLSALPLAAPADDVSGARHLLCSTLSSDVCFSDAGCTNIAPAEINIPQFIRLDARSGKLATTAASGENRETTAQNVSRSDGQLILQGVEAGRAFSLFIHEASGHATFAAASDAMSVTVFAACTPELGN